MGVWGFHDRYWSQFISSELGCTWFPFDIVGQQMGNACIVIESLYGDAGIRRMDIYRRYRCALRRLGMLDEDVGWTLYDILAHMSS